MNCLFSCCDSFLKVLMLRVHYEGSIFLSTRNSLTKVCFTHRYSRLTNENVIPETHHVLAYSFLSNMHKEKNLVKSTYI